MAARGTSVRLERGVALISVLIFAVVFLLLIGTLLNVLAMETHAVGSSAQSDAALTAAYAGIDAQILAIEEFYVNGVGSGNPPDAGRHVFLSRSGLQWTTAYNAAIVKTYLDQHAGRRYFLIQANGFITDSTGTNDSTPNRQVTALVREGDFGQFSSFTNSETSNTGGKLWYASGQHYDGLVYSGGPMHIYYTPGNAQPIFGAGFVTGPNSPIHWFNSQTSSTAAPTRADPGWGAVFAPGTGWSTGTEDLPGLSQNLVIFSEAFHGDSDHNAITNLQQDTAGLQDGIYVNGQSPSGGTQNLSTGIFVQGDAQLQATSTPTTQTFAFTWPGNPAESARVAVDFSSNQTTVTENGSTTTYNGVPSGTSSTGNGAIFVNGNLTITDGSTIHGQYTIALPDPPTDGQALTVKGSLQYQDDPRNDPASTDELALWANDVILDDQTSGDLTLDGMIITGYVNECTAASGGCRPDGAFYNRYCRAHGCGGGRGQLTLYGSLIQNIRGKLGELDANGQLLSGFVREPFYDGRLGANPPPFTPTTNVYDIVAVSDDGSP